MKNSKIIFIDVDGTLLNEAHKVPETTRKAVNLARKNSHKIYLSTGRSKAEIDEDIWSVGFDGIIGGNGSFIEHQGTMLEHKTVPYEHAKHAINWMDDHGVDYYAESNSGLYASKNFLPNITKIFQGDVSIESMEKTKATFIGMKFDENPLREDLNKFSFMLNDIVTFEDMAREFSEEFIITPWSFAIDQERYGDLSQKDINKGTAIDKLLKHLQADKADTVGIGDSTNDMEMLTLCGIGIAMGNAKQELKNIADYVTTEVNEDGIWNAFIKYGII